MMSDSLQLDLLLCYACDFHIKVKQVRDVSTCFHLTHISSYNKIKAEQIKRIFLLSLVFQFCRIQAFHISPNRDVHIHQFQAHPRALDR